MKNSSKKSTIIFKVNQGVFALLSIGIAAYYLDYINVFKYLIFGSVGMFNISIFLIFIFIFSKGQVLKERLDYSKLYYRSEFKTSNKFVVVLRNASLLFFQFSMAFYILFYLIHYGLGMSLDGLDLMLSFPFLSLALYFLSNVLSKPE